MPAKITGYTVVDIVTSPNMALTPDYKDIKSHPSCDTPLASFTVRANNVLYYFIYNDNYRVQGYTIARNRQTHRNNSVKTTNSRTSSSMIKCFFVQPTWFGSAYKLDAPLIAVSINACRAILWTPPLNGTTGLMESAPKWRMNSFVQVKHCKLCNSCKASWSTLTARS